MAAQKSCRWLRITAARNIENSRGRFKEAYTPFNDFKECSYDNANYLYRPSPKALCIHYSFTSEPFIE